MAKLSSFLFVLALLSLLRHISSSDDAALPHTADGDKCLGAAQDMTGCLSFIKVGSNVEKPNGMCCGGLKNLMKADPKCLCAALKMTGANGMLNTTKALSLPSSCGLKSPPPEACGIGGAPAPVPASAPGASSASAPGASSASALAPGSPKASPFGKAPASGPAPAPVPVPAPASATHEAKKSGASSSTPVSFATLFVGVIVASVAYC